MHMKRKILNKYKNVYKFLINIINIKNKYIRIRKKIILQIQNITASKKKEPCRVEGQSIVNKFLLML